jgi:hypothetical protein
MVAQQVEVFDPSLRADVAACPDCSLFWFGQRAAVRLKPRSVIALFQYVGASKVAANTPLASRFNCPSCHSLLQFTSDLQRTTRFSYWRCEFERGQLITFHQFLREKNFIRTPSPAELERLRETVKQVSCSQCGAPIDLEKDSACSHCGAAVALIDPDGVTKALQALQSAAQAPPGGAEAARAALADAQIEAIFSVERAKERRERAEQADLLTLGFNALGGLLEIALSRAD